MTPLEFKTIDGLENIDKVIEINQSPIGRTPRSNPATYCGFFTDIRTLFAAVPEAKRKVITTHDAFGYFGAAYGVTFMAPEGMSTESEASAADVAKLIEQIKKDGVSALFVENMSDPRLIEQIAKETSVKLGGSLYTDALSEKTEPGSTYIEMFKHNISLLAPAMAGS